MSKAHEYTIIGGGTAGLAVATRLTEDATINMLMLEARENRLRGVWKEVRTCNTPGEEVGKALARKIIDASLHDTKGLVGITFPHSSSDLDALWTLWRPTFQVLDLGAVVHAKKGITLLGYAALKFIDQKAERTTSASSYYAPNAGRPNLSVLTGAHVHRILFSSSSGPRAIGVRWLEKFTRFQQAPRSLWLRAPF